MYCICMCCLQYSIYIYTPFRTVIFVLYMSLGKIYIAKRTKKKKSFFLGWYFDDNDDLYNTYKSIKYLQLKALSSSPSRAKYKILRCGKMVYNIEQKKKIIIQVDCKLDCKYILCKCMYNRKSNKIYRKKKNNK